MHAFFGWLRGAGFFFTLLALILLYVNYFRTPRSERKGRAWAESPGLQFSLTVAAVLVVVGWVGQAITR